MREKWTRLCYSRIFLTSHCIFVMRLAASLFQLDGRQNLWRKTWSSEPQINCPCENRPRAMPLFLRLWNWTLLMKTTTFKVCQWEKERSLMFLCSSRFSTNIGNIRGNNTLKGNKQINKKVATKTRQQSSPRVRKTAVLKTDNATNNSTNNATRVGLGCPRGTAFTVLTEWSVHFF